MRMFRALILVHLATLAAAAAGTPQECLASCGVESCHDSHGRHLQFGLNLEALSGLNDAYTTLHRYVAEGLLYASNLAFVVLMALGFAWLPKKLMLIVALIGVFGPIAAAWIAASFIGGTVEGAATIGPSIVESVFALFALAVTVAATNPGLAVLALWVGFFLTSEVFQFVLDKAGCDLNNDGKVGWRDLLIALFSWMSRNKFGNCMTAFALDELTDGMRKRSRAIRQNEEILERVERLEAMLIAMGGPDLRDEQKQDPDHMIDHTSQRVGAKARTLAMQPAALPTPQTSLGPVGGGGDAGAAYAPLHDSEA